MPLSIEGTDRGSFVVGVTVFGAAATPDSLGQAIVFFDTRDAVQELRCRRSDEGRTDTFQLDLIHGASLEEVIALPGLCLDSCMGVGCEKVHRNLPVPHYVQPFTKILSILYGDLNKERLVEWSLALRTQRGVSLVSESLETKCDIR